MTNGKKMSTNSTDGDGLLFNEHLVSGNHKCISEPLFVRLCRSNVVNALHMRQCVNQKDHRWWSNGFVTKLRVCFPSLYFPLFGLVQTPGNTKLKTRLVASARESGNITAHVAYPTFLHTMMMMMWYDYVCVTPHFQVNFFHVLPWNERSYIAELTLIYSLRYFLISRSVLLSVESAFGLSPYPFD